MKVSKGFLMKKDPDTGRMVPFFVKVRPQDIVSGNSGDGENGGLVTLDGKQIDFPLKLKTVPTFEIFSKDDPLTVYTSGETKYTITDNYILVLSVPEGISSGYVNQAVGDYTLYHRGKIEISIFDKKTKKQICNKEFTYQDLLAVFSNVHDTTYSVWESINFANAYYENGHFHLLLVEHVATTYNTNAGNYARQAIYRDMIILENEFYTNKNIEMQEYRIYDGTMSGVLSSITTKLIGETGLCIGIESIFYSYYYNNQFNIIYNDYTHTTDSYGNDIYGGKFYCVSVDSNTFETINKLLLCEVSNSTVLPSLNIRIADLYKGFLFCYWNTSNFAVNLNTHEVINNQNVINTQFIFNDKYCWIHGCALYCLDDLLSTPKKSTINNFYAYSNSAHLVYYPMASTCAISLNDANSEIFVLKNKIVVDMD